MHSVILSATRTPIGAFNGSLSSLAAPRLGAVAIAAAVEKAGIDKATIDEVIMGNVLTGGVGQAPARQASIYAGLSNSIPALTINKVCGSGLKAVMLADQSIRLNETNLAVAGGQESMSNAPYILPKARTGYRMGNGELVDSMIADGLWDVYNNYHMGNAGELCAVECKISREEQDEFAVASYKRALAAQENGWYADEIVPVEIKSRRGSVIVDKDEEPGKIKFEKVPALRTVFKKDGTVTAANASSIDDGASALVIASDQRAADLNIKPLAKIIASATFAQAPEWFTTAPTEAIKRVLAKANMTIADIDLFEINEAFASVPIITQRELNINHDVVNIHGGAIALGHPIGASGARVLTTLVHSLILKDKQFGIASLCIGGGEAVAMLIERV